MDFAWAALPLIVVADELAFAPAKFQKAPTPSPVAVAVAFAVPPSIAVEVAVAIAGPQSAAAAGRLSNCRSSIGCASVCSGGAPKAKTITE